MVEIFKASFKQRNSKLASNCKTLEEQNHILIAKVRALENELTMNGQNNANVLELKERLGEKEGQNEELSESLQKVSKEAQKLRQENKDLKLYH